jgi:translation initiation factor 3 subunit L
MSDDEKHHSDSEEETRPRKQEVIPDAVDHFLGRLLKAVETRNIAELNQLYEDDYNKLTEKHYKNTNSRWPSVDAVKEQVSPHPLFLILYRELYYRHVYTRESPNFETRKGSWENYCMLIDLIILDLQAGEELSVALPPQWVWDILDEFIYHYQTYCQFRNKTLKAQKEELHKIKEAPDVFETQKLMSYLQQLVKWSRIEEYLANPSNPENQSGGAWTDETTRLFGYFGLMQLLRMHSLLGDFFMAMKTIEKIDFDEEVPLFYKIPACHVTLYYYMGFAYIMMRRYADAIRTFTDILVFISKTFGLNHASYQYDQMMKKQEQMYALLLICTALCPRSIDESLEKHIEKQYQDKQAKLYRGDEFVFEELFSYACPKFVSAALPDVAPGSEFDASEAHKRQVQLFLKEVRQQQFLPRIGSYMKLYTAIKTSKLAQLCEMDEEGLRDQLMCVMHKTQQRVRNKGAPLDGDRQVCSEVEFYLDGDMVHINAHKTEQAHADVFLEQILKFQDLLKKIGKDEK